MKYVISFTLLFSQFLCTALYAEGLRESALKAYAADSGFVPAHETWPEFNLERAEIGRQLFESELLSLTQNVSCRSCHLDEFGSSDGLPIAHGAGGIGKGIERIGSPAGLLARNTLPLWGRGGRDFNVFFWDGKVDGTSSFPISQFGYLSPSNDALTVAVHLPPLEFREMIGENDNTEWLRNGDLDSVFKVQEIIVDRIKSNLEISSELSRIFQIDKNEISYIHIAESLAAFIRFNFRVEETKFHQFVFGGENLTDQEVSGGLIFYGRGRCVICHNGPYFSDQDFHVIPFNQFGFGINGFGVDYGRFNVTQDPADLYKFRTPPLLNVAKTAPYSHSGFSNNLESTIRAHVDPLANVDASAMTTTERAEMYHKLSLWSQSFNYSSELSDTDISDLVSFLNTLSF